MSMAIKRAQYTGDPGFFGDIFRGIKGAAGGIMGGPLGMLGGAAEGYMRGRQPAIPTAGPGSVQITHATATARVKGRLGRAFDRLTGESQGDRNRRVDALVSQEWQGTVPAPGILPAIQRILPGGATGMMMAPGMGMVVGGGYHPNKSDYFLMSGEFVPAGSRMVKNRKRNPANARATSRAIGRIKGAKKYASALSAISIRKKC